MQALLLLAALISSTGAVDRELSDPIPAKIQRGDIVVGVVDYVRVPKSQDSSDQYTNNAYARIQYLMPLGNTFGALIINDTRGILYRTDDRASEPLVYLDLREQDVGFYDALFPNEMGLAGMAFHPEFTAVGKPGFGKFYTAYSTKAGGLANYLADDAASHNSVVREWTAYNPRGRVFQGTSREIMRIGQFAPNHNIGTIAFNPTAEIGSTDYGVLYIGLGDGGVANDPKNYGQQTSEPLSSILRIRPLDAPKGQTYGIPLDNPFLNDTQAAPEVWAYGLRNPQHYSWDSRGRMFISDIGQNHIEEVNLGQAGGNYGWRLREGSFATAMANGSDALGAVFNQPKNDGRFVEPIAQYDHDEGKAIGGGFVYEGSAIPELHGKFVFSDLVTGRLFYIDVAQLMPGKFSEIRELRLQFGGQERALIDITNFANSYEADVRVDLRLGIDALGEIYLLTKSDGWVRKLVALVK
jgi:glucose/arabinose dehydrogenase